MKHKDVICPKEKWWNQWLIVGQVYSCDFYIQLMFMLQQILVFSSYRSWMQLYISSPLGLASCQENNHFFLLQFYGCPRQITAPVLWGTVVIFLRFLREAICLFCLMKTVISICHWLVQHSMQNDIICEQARRKVPQLHLAVECSCNRSVLLQTLHSKFSSVVPYPTQCHYTSKKNCP